MDRTNLKTVFEDKLVNLTSEINKLVKFYDTWVEGNHTKNANEKIACCKLIIKNSKKLTEITEKQLVKEFEKKVALAKAKNK